MSENLQSETLAQVAEVNIPTKQEVELAVRLRAAEMEKVVREQTNTKSGENELKSQHVESQESIVGYNNSNYSRSNSNLNINRPELIN